VITSDLWPGSEAVAVEDAADDSSLHQTFVEVGPSLSCRLLFLDSVMKHNSHRPVLNLVEETQIVPTAV